MAAENIFGPDVGSLKGKTVRQTPDAVRLSNFPIPESIFERYKDVIIAADIMYLGRMAFLVTISRNLRFGTTEMIRNQKNETIIKAIRNVVNIYEGRGFKVSHFLMDGQFNSLKDEISGLGINLNTVARQEHVPEVERYIRTLKERVRSHYNTMPFTPMPPRMIIELVHYCNFWLNCFPNEDGVSRSLSPRLIVTGNHINYVKHCKLEFGEYVQTHEEHNNTMDPRTIGAIALRPTGNAQGSYLFFSLNSGRVITRNKWTALPMPDDVIDRVKAMASLGVDTTHEYEDDEGPMLQEPIDAGEELLRTIEAVEDDTINPRQGPVFEIMREEPRLGEPDGEDIEDIDMLEDDALNDIEEQEDNNEVIDEAGDIEILAENDQNIEQPAELNLDDEMEIRYGPRNSNYDLRPRRPRDYSHLHATMDHTCMTQYRPKLCI